MKVFWFIYSALMVAPAILVAFMYYAMSETGACKFYEYDILIRNAELVCAFTFALLAVAGWILATVLLFKREKSRG